MRKRLCVVSLFLAFSVPAFSSPEPNSPVTEETTVLKEEQVEMPSLLDKKESQSPVSLVVSMLIFLALIAAGCYGVVYYFKRGGSFALKMKKGESRLKIAETRMLGNRQFLVVAEYGCQRILLGVGPNGIQHLCYLEPDAEKFPEVSSE